MKCTFVMIQMNNNRWVDSIWIVRDSAEVRRDLIMGQFKNMGFDPRPSGPFSWVAESMIEDAKAVLPENGAGSAAKTKPEVNAK